MRGVATSVGRDRAVARYRRGSVFAHQQSSGFGSRLRRTVLILLCLILVGGAVYLGLSDFRPPTETVEKEIPRERFMR